MTYTPESDLNHNRISPDHRYSCHNGDRPKTIAYQSQNGWTEDGRRAMVDHVTEWLDIPCGHSYSGSDPNCQGCKWR